MASRTKLREEAAQARSDLLDASMMPPGDPRAASLVEAALARLQAVAEGGDDPTERTPEQQARHDRIIEEARLAYFPDSDRGGIPVGLPRTRSLREAEEGFLEDALMAPFREAGGYMLREGSTADVGRLGQDARTADLDNISSIAELRRAILAYSDASMSAAPPVREARKEALQRAADRLGATSELPAHMREAESLLPGMRPLREGGAVGEAVRGHLLPEERAAADGQYGGLVAQMTREAGIKRAMKSGELELRPGGLLDAMGLDPEDVNVT